MGKEVEDVWDDDFLGNMFTWEIELELFSCGSVFALLAKDTQNKS